MRQHGRPSTQSVQDQCLFRLYVSRGFNNVWHLTPLMRLMQAVGLMLRKWPLWAQRERLQGQQGKRGYFGGGGGVQSAVSHQSRFREQPKKMNTCLEQELQNCFRPVAANTLSLKHSEHSRVATSPHTQHSLGPAGVTGVRGRVFSRSPLKSNLSCQNWCSGKKNHTMIPPYISSQPREARPVTWLLTVPAGSFTIAQQLTVKQQICYIQLQGRNDFTEHFIFLPKTWHLDNEARWDLEKERQMSHPARRDKPQRLFSPYCCWE